MTPVKSPPITTSSRNPGLSHMLATGETKIAVRKSIISPSPAPLPLREREGPIAQRWEGEGAGAAARYPSPGPLLRSGRPTTRSIALRSNPLGADRKAVGRVVPARGEGLLRTALPAHHPSCG